MAACLSVITNFKYDWGQEVRVTTNSPDSLRPGSAGSVCGMREFNGGRFYLVEFSDGTAIEILEEFLEPLTAT
jgi:hypothetical protein